MVASLLEAAPGMFKKKCTYFRKAGHACGMDKKGSIAVSQVCVIFST